MTTATKDGILIWGAGAIGGSVGAHLARAGHAVTLVDVSRPHVDAIAERGLSIVGPIEQFTIAIPASLPQNLRGRWRTVMLAVKSQYTAAACDALCDHFDPGGGILSLQNGLMGEVIARKFGRQQVFCALGSIAADVLAPGEIRFGGSYEMPIGQIDGLGGTMCNEFVSLMQQFEPQTFAAPDIQNYLWSKHVFNTTTCASALASSPLAQIVGREDLKQLWGDLNREVLRVAIALGIRPYKFGPFDPMDFAPDAAPGASDAYLAILVAETRKSTKPHSGMWRDLAIHHRQTEVEALLAPIAERGEAFGLASPLLRGVVRMIGEIERGQRRQDDDNLLELMRGAA